MAIIAKFISYDGGIAFSDSVMQIKKSDSSTRIPLSDVTALDVRKPHDDSEGFIRILTSNGQRYRLFYEDDQYEEAVQFKEHFDTVLDDADKEFALEPVPAKYVTPRFTERPAKTKPAPSMTTPVPSSKKHKKRPVTRKWWFWAACAVVVIGVVSILGGDPNTSNTSPSGTTITSTSLSGGAAADPDTSSAGTNDTNVPTEYLSALASAETYSSVMHMSKAGIYDQLTSEYGDKFSAEAAQYAVDNVSADWNANALASAESYSETMHMSKAGIYDQLISEYGEKFTPEEAQYAIDNINADWKANALASAKSYQENSGLSPSAIHDQLTSEYGEKFTQEEADYAIANLN